MAGPVYFRPQQQDQGLAKAALLSNALGNAAETLFRAEQMMRQRKKDDLATLTAAAGVLGGYDKLPGQARTKLVDLLNIEGLPTDASGAPIFTPSVEKQIKDTELLTIQADQAAAALGDENAITRMGIRGGTIAKTPNPEEVRLKEADIAATAALALARQAQADATRWGRKYEADLKATTGLNAPSGMVKIRGRSVIIDEAAAQDLGMSPEDYASVSYDQLKAVGTGRQNITAAGVKKASTDKFKATLAMQLAEIPELGERVKAAGDLSEGDEISKAMSHGLIIGLGGNLGRALPNVNIEDIAEEEFGGLGIFNLKKDSRLINAFKTAYVTGQAEARNTIREHETTENRQPIGTDLLTGKDVYMEDFRGSQKPATPTPAAAEVVEDTEQGVISYFLSQANNPNVVPNQLISDVITQTGLDPAAVKAMYIKAQQQSAAGVQ